MTREEAIKRLEVVRTNALIQKANGASEYWQEEIDGTIEAIDMAIEALKGGDAEVNETKSPYMQSRPNGADLISRADAIALLTEIVFDEPPYFDSETLCRLYAEEQINTLPSAEIAETEPIAIRSKTLMPTKDFKEWAKRIREINPNAVVIPCDAEVVSADAVQGWRKGKPTEQGKYMVTIDSFGHKRIDLFYYGKPLMPNRKVRGKCWYRSDDEWGDVVYDNKDILAWQPLPKPYKGGDDE